MIRVYNLWLLYRLFLSLNVALKLIPYQFDVLLLPLRLLIVFHILSPEVKVLQQTIIIVLDRHRVVPDSIMIFVGCLRGNRCNMINRLVWILERFHLHVKDKFTSFTDTV